MTEAIAGQRVWDVADSAEAARLGESFRARWSRRGARAGNEDIPSPRDFLPDASSPDRPGLLLALLRVDLRERRRALLPSRPEWYARCYPDLPEAGLVALIYEDYCAREEAGEAVSAGDYDDRFPGLRRAVRELIEIHEAIGAPGFDASAPSGHPESPAAPYPAAGDDVGGFLLVEEVGRGAFARVFLARERPLGDRPVALKVSRTRSREPQTLARLQHTHIVPIYSYRTDPDTGFQLICMPYFGRQTLATLVGVLAQGDPRTGLDLVAALNRLGVVEGPRGSGPSAHSRLASRTYAQAVAFWGARLAEALGHAHGRGVLHRDVKPSNVLIGDDAMPLLLDFNLAREAAPEPGATDRLGGTLAYMAPEQIDAILEGTGDGSGNADGSAPAIDHRADIYSLGMVLLEVINGKPLEVELGSIAPTAGIDQLLTVRKRRVDSFRSGRSTVPASLTSVLRRCLEDRPAGRYASAAELAVDLQAVADGEPLRFAREPWPSRAGRWTRRNRRRLLVAVPSALALALMISTQFRLQANRVRAEIHAFDLYDEANHSMKAEEFVAASSQFQSAAALVADRADLLDLRLDALARREEALAANEARRRADAFFASSEAVRFALLGLSTDNDDASREAESTLKALGVLNDEHWADRPEWIRLDPDRRARLLAEVDDLLFFWAASMAPGAGRSAAEADRSIALCDRAMAYSRHRAPWAALRAAWLGRDGRDHLRPEVPADPSLEGSASVCFRWYLLGRLTLDEGRRVDWLKRANWLQPDNFWHQFALAYELYHDGRHDDALNHYDLSVALRPRLCWPRMNRANLFSLRGDWSMAAEDLEIARRNARSGQEEARVDLEMGLLREKLGDVVEAIRLNRQARRPGPGGPGGVDRLAHRQMARILADWGWRASALRACDRLVVDDPDDRRTRRLRADLRRKAGDLLGALGDLDRLVRGGGGDRPAEDRGARAWCLERLGRLDEAEASAVESLADAPSGWVEAIRDRSRLARGLDLDPLPASPDFADAWLPARPDLRPALRAMADRLAPDRSPEARQARVALLAALGLGREALAEADRWAVDEPASASAALARGRALRRLGDPDAARGSADRGLSIAPSDPRLLELLGRTLIDQGRVAEGAAELELASARGRAGPCTVALAGAFDRLGRPREAADLWQREAQVDPTAIRPLVEYARLQRRLGDVDRAVASLEEARGRLDDQPAWAPALLAEYLKLAPHRPRLLLQAASLLGRLAARG